MKHYYYICLLAALFATVSCDRTPKVHEKNVREMVKPFRMAKINLIWDKALQVILKQIAITILLVLCYAFFLLCSVPNMAHY